MEEVSPPDGTGCMGGYMGVHEEIISCGTYVMCAGTKMTFMRCFVDESMTLYPKWYTL